MKGWRTVGFGAVLAVVPGLLTYADSIDWSAYGPWITSGAGLAVMGLRFLTTTPVGRKA